MSEQGFDETRKKRLAVVFPGIGYHKDKPLLYYSIKLARAYGYEILNIEYHDMPSKIQGDKAMMKKAYDIAREQVCEQLDGVDFTEYEKVCFIGKSIGTILAAGYAAEHKLSPKQIWYTPLEATFSFEACRPQDVTAFIGDDDPWSVVEDVKKLAAKCKITMPSYPRCNHSLESGDVTADIEVLRDVMKKTKEFMASFD